MVFPRRGVIKYNMYPVCQRVHKRGFETSLSIKSIPGVSKKSNGAQRYRTFDLNTLRKHFQIEPEVRIPVDIDDPE